jgi:class 3 adenylate cyclase
MSMNEQDAKQRLTEYLRFLQGDIGYHLPTSWLSDNPRFCQQPNGDWLVTHPDDSHNGVLLKSDGTTFPFFGALGKLVQQLGLPASREYFLASAFHGRYQVYDKGLAIWEALEDIGDVGYPVARWESIDKRAKSCLALIAFFDLRGFTNWSASQDAKRIQDVIEGVEQSFQNAFSRRWCLQLFAKSTGDGFMVISEAGRYASGGQAPDASFQLGHAKAFCRACAETVRNAAAQIPDALAIGCGVTIGPITQLYLLGRFDYIGPQVNEASKIQTIAYNELCLSTEVVERLRKDGVEIEGKVLPGKGMRVTAESLTPE